jgi:hypothetical protein
MTELNVMRMHSNMEFQTWLANDLEVRDELAEMVGAELSTDITSLDTLEAFLLKRYPDPDAILRLNERAVLDASARHVGLIMLLHIDGAEWTIDLEDEDNVYYRLPIIRFSDGAEECPLTMVTASLDRRTGHYLRTVVEAFEEQYNEEEEEK